MNFISPDIIMQKALNNQQFRKIDDIYPPTENDFNKSLNHFIDNLHKQQSQTPNMENLQQMQQQTQNSQTQEQSQQSQQPQNQQFTPKKLETFYIPTKNVETYKNTISKFNITSETIIKILIFIIIFMFCIIIYLKMEINTLKQFIRFKIMV